MDLGDSMGLQDGQAVGSSLAVLVSHTAACLLSLHPSASATCMLPLLATAMLAPIGDAAQCWIFPRFDYE